GNQHPSGINLYNAIFECTYCQTCAALCPQTNCGSTSSSSASATSATAATTSASTAQSSSGAGAGTGSGQGGSGPSGAGGSAPSDTPTHHPRSANNQEEGGCAMAPDAGSGDAGRAIPWLLALVAAGRRRRRQRS